MHWLHWLMVHGSQELGISQSASRAYNFWSGVAGELSWLGAAFVLWRRHVCHVNGCVRIGRHHVEGTGYVTCAHHHPTVPSDGITADHIADAHQRARERR